MFEFPFSISGITPAYAGKRRKKQKNFLGNWDHPRLCGEKFQKDVNNYVFRGSPPPMRGKVPAIGSAVLAAGITPAYAGKSR